MAELPPIPWETQKNTPRALSMKRAGMLIDLRRCTGCHACSVSCKTEHDVPLGGFRTRVRYLEQEEEQQLSFLPLMCMHCQDAPCLDACPTSAISKMSDGHVVINQDNCNGNKACMTACPYGAIYIETETGKADKCDMCTHRTSLNMDPACVTSCPTDALRFGDLDNPEDPVSIYAKDNDAKAFKEELGTKPNVLYVAHDKWMEQATTTGIQLGPDDDEIIYEQKHND